MTRILAYEVEDDLVDEARATGRALCRVYRPQEVAVVLGRGGDAARELHLGAIDADHVPVYRRPGGGGAVVLDPGNVVVTLVLPMAGLGGIPVAFKAASDLVIAALAACGVPGVVQRGVSDLALGDRKLGGSCLRRERGLAHYTTTLLVAPDLALLDRYLQHPPREPEYRAGRAHREFVTSLAAAGYPYSASSLTADLYGKLHNLLIDLRF